MSPGLRLALEGALQRSPSLRARIVGRAGEDVAQARAAGEDSQALAVIEQLLERGGSGSAGSGNQPRAPLED
ncbi:hypothetical protein ENSA5_59040 [Enhygromyxa salina]|uniref:Uncharacterized protein n=1 Tax=Enhygromyxa salina TaxID=215803 RepID=A0A2S9XDW3_9BACT|nr:hypothetical protein [Enhygromyxa salina]PRP91055.1 hypothetical protein ENSA5_59040 [Enhygromyxa salina]